MTERATEEKTAISSKGTKPLERRARVTLRDVLVGRALSWTGKMVRITVYFIFVAGLLALVAARAAYAHAKKVAMETGQELARLTSAGNMSGVYRLRLNGELVKVTSATSDLAPEAVLDRLQQSCEKHADGLAEDFAQLPHALKSTGAMREVGHPGVGIVRQSDSESGFIMCFAIGDTQTETGMYGRMVEFAKTGDLGSIGHVRYAVVKKGETAPSHVVAMWTEGSLDMKKMFPEEGDAPGNDAPGVLRPPSARRVLTAYAEGAPYGVRVYTSAMGRDAILKEYDATMVKLGWTTYPEATNAAPFSRAFSKEGIDVLVTTEPSSEGTSVSIVEMGGS